MPVTSLSSVSSKQIPWVSPFLDEETTADLAAKVPAAAGGQAQKQENWYFPFNDLHDQQNGNKKYRQTNTCI